MFLLQGSEWALWVYRLRVPQLWRQSLAVLCAVEIGVYDLSLQQAVSGAVGMSSAQTHSLGAAGPANHLQDLGLLHRPFDKEGGTSLF